MKRNDWMRSLAMSGVMAAAGVFSGLSGAMAAGMGVLEPEDPNARLDPAALTLPAHPESLPAPGTFRIQSAPRAGDTQEVFHSALTGETAISRLPAEARTRIQAAGPRVEAGYAGAQRSSFGITAVLGSDERERVGNTTVLPWSAQCKLIMTYPNGKKFIGSGTLIGAKHVLTAGHCVFSHDDGGWARSIEVIPGLDGAYKPFGSAWASQMRSYTGWTRDRNRDHDFGFITLNQEIGNKTGWLGYASFGTVTGMNAHLAGYPGDLAGGTGLYYSHGPINDSTGYQVFYGFDTAGGESGSGIYRKLGNERHVFAVHCWGNSDRNGGTRLNSTKFDSIKAWKAL